MGGAQGRGGNWATDFRQPLMTFLAFALVKTDDDPLLQFVRHGRDKPHFQKQHGEERVYLPTLPNPSPLLKETGTGAPAGTGAETCRGTLTASWLAPWSPWSLLS